MSCRQRSCVFGAEILWRCTKLTKECTTKTYPSAVSAQEYLVLVHDTFSKNIIDKKNKQLCRTFWAFAVYYTNQLSSQFWWILSKKYHGPALDISPIYTGKKRVCGMSRKWRKQLQGVLLWHLESILINWFFKIWHDWLLTHTST